MRLLFALTIAIAFALPMTAQAGHGGGAAGNATVVSKTNGANPVAGSHPNTASGSDAGKGSQSGGTPSTATGKGATKGTGGGGPPSTATGKGASKGTGSKFDGKNPANIVKQSQHPRTE